MYEDACSSSAVPSGLAMCSHFRQDVSFICSSFVQFSFFNLFFLNGYGRDGCNWHAVVVMILCAAQLLKARCEAIKNKRREEQVK